MSHDGYDIDLILTRLSYPPAISGVVLTKVGYENLRILTHVAHTAIMKYRDEKLTYLTTFLINNPMFGAMIARSV
jgi:hypothetical protein